MCGAVLFSRRKEIREEEDRIRPRYFFTLSGIFFFYFLKWNGTCNGRLFLLELKWLESKEAKKKKKSGNVWISSREAWRRKKKRRNHADKFYSPLRFFSSSAFSFRFLDCCRFHWTPFHLQKKKSCVRDAFFFLCNFKSFDSYPVGRFD